MKHLLIILLALSLTACVTYKPSVSRPEIVSILAIDSKGDTIQVSTDYLEREFRSNPTNYSNWRFYWDNSWYWGNGWFNNYNPYWNNPRWIYPQRPIIIQRPRVQTQQPRRTYVPRHFEPRNPTPPSRGRSNVQPQQQRQTPMVRPQQPRTAPQRGVVPNRNNNQNRKPIQY